MDRRKGRVSTPLEIDQLARSIREALDLLTQGKYSFREAHSYVRGSRRDARRTDENKGIRISNSHVSDPTAEIVESQEWNQRRLVQAGALLAAADDAVKAAVGKTRDVFSHPDDYYQKLESYRS